MNKDRGMFRIYRCMKCNNIGYCQVDSEEDTSNCSLCQMPILHEPGTVYAVTRQEAQILVRNLAIEHRISRNASRQNTSRSLGIKKRVYYIIEALVELKRGKPASLEDILRECNEAGIDLSRAMKFIDDLELEGSISNDGVNISIIRKEWFNGEF